MDNILDHVVVQGQRYDIVSPTAFGDNIETIGSACINPDGYAQGSTFLARLGNEQFYYEATAAITQGSTILEGTNCKKTTVTGREAELASEIETLGETVDSLNEALTNEVEARATLGAHNLLPNNATTQVINGVTFTVNSDGIITANGTATANATEIRLCYFEKTDLINAIGNMFKLSGCPAGGSMSSRYALYVTLANRSDDSYAGALYDVGNGNEFSIDSDVYIRSCYIIIANGFTANGLTFKPMIRLASDTDSTYQPYAMTNSELTEKVDKIETINLTLNSTYFDNNTVCKVKKVGKLVSICISGTTIGEIPSGNTNLSSNGALPTPDDGEGIIGFAWNTSGILGQLRINYGYLNFPFNVAIPSGTSFRVNMVYIST